MLRLVLGPLLNAAGILAGGIGGLTRTKPLPPSAESGFRILLGVFTVFYGLRLTWVSLNGTGWQIPKQLLIAVLALMLGKLAGRALGLQRFSNRLGRGASSRIKSARPGAPVSAGAGFETCAALFCAAPLGLLGAVQDGLSGYFYPLVIKAVMDGLAAMGFVSLFGGGVILSLIPVLAFQGTVSLACAQYVGPFLEAHSSGGHELINAVNATGGLLVFSVALVILELKKVELADYLPSLLFAPAIAWIWR